MFRTLRLHKEQRKTGKTANSKTEGEVTKALRNDFFHKKYFSFI